MRRALRWGKENRSDSRRGKNSRTYREHHDREERQRSRAEERREREGVQSKEAEVQRLEQRGACEHSTRERGRGKIRLGGCREGQRDGEQNCGAEK